MRNNPAKAPLLFTTVALTVGLVLTGCSANTAEPKADPAAAATSSAAVAPAVESTPSASPSPTESLPPEAEASIKALKKEGVTLGKVIKVKDGSYPQYVVDPKSRIATFDPGKHSEGTPKGWTTADLGKAQAFASTMMLNIVLDNPTVRDFEDNKKQFAGMLKDVVAPKELKNFTKTVNSTKTTVFLSDTFTHESYAGDKTAGFRFTSNGKTPRLSDISKLEVTASENYKGDVYYEYNGMYTANVVDKADVNYEMLHSISYGLTITKDGGKFLITGAQFHDGNYDAPERVNS